MGVLNWRLPVVEEIYDHYTTDGSLEEHIVLRSS